VTKTTVNDRVGNVRSFYYDGWHRLVIARDYTGRPDGDGPTSIDRGLNLPGRPLRASDPAYFETRYEYNEDSLCTRILRPLGDSEQFVYDTGSGDPRFRGHLLQHVRLAGPIGGDQREIAESFEYDRDTGHLLRRVDPRGNETRYAFDEAGNCTRIQHALPSIVEYFEYNAFGQLTARIRPAYSESRRSRDEFIYGASGLERGYLQKQVLDVRGLAVTTSWEYDELGRPVRFVDGRGQEALGTWNALDQLVSELSREVTPGSGPRVQRRYRYDAADNLVAVESGFLDERGSLSDGQGQVTYDYDLLNCVVRETRRVNAGQMVATEYVYDRNRNLTLTRLGEAVGGRQPNNTVATLFDERDLPFRVIRASGDPLQSSMQYDYDGNGRLSRISEGLETPAPHVTSLVHDGFGRLIRRTDAMGNEESLHYDPAGNRVSRRIDGETSDAAGSAGNVRLAESAFEYDEMNRLSRRIDRFFDPPTQTPFEGGEVVTRFEYTDSGRLRRQVDEQGHVTSCSFDGLGRCTLQRDARGNSTTYTYDANSNVVGITQTDRSDLDRRDDVFTQTLDYDGLDRLVRRVDPAGHTWRYRWDAQGNCTQAADPRGSRTAYAYDGLNRLVQTVIDMNDNGPAAADAADVAISKRWDDSSRLMSQTDSNLNTTSYTYDPLGRRIATRLADGTVLSSVFDPFDCAISTTDPNGTVVRSTYDALNRVVARSIGRAPGVSGTTTESYTYDGLSRLVGGSDDDSVFTRRYDSLSHLIRETQQVGPGGPTREVSASYDGLGRRLTLRYPGGRLIAASYDPLGRPTAIRDETPGSSALIAAYNYAGADRIERRDMGNGLRLQVDYDTDGRVENIRYVAIAGGTVLLQRSYAWDPGGNCTRVEAGVGSTESIETREYAYDAANRLVQSQRSGPGSAGPVSVIYTLDGAGNRSLVTGGPDAGPYLLDPSTPEPADLQMNQYTAVPGQPRTYDRNGNLTTAGPGRRYSYDFRGQLTELTDLVAGLTVIYKYDVLGRRIEKNVNGVITRHYFAGMQEIEEQAPSNITISTFVQPIPGSAGPLCPTPPAADCGRPNACVSPFIESTLQIARGAQRWFLLGDAIGNCLALASASGAITEQYDYSDFGRPAFIDTGGNALSASIASNPFLFRGCRFDAETGLYLAPDAPGGDGARAWDTGSARLLSRRRINPWSDPASPGNARAAWEHNPISPPSGQICSTPR
jgi:YD repeat-containing protein